MATARFLARQRPRALAFVIGEGGLLTALHANGFAIDDQRPDYVIVGEPTHVVDSVQNLIDHDLILGALAEWRQERLIA